MPRLGISSFSLFSKLGPLHLETREADGTVTPVLRDFPQEVTLEEFVSLVRERVGASAVELCQIHFASRNASRIALLRRKLDASDVQMLSLLIDTGDLAGTNPDWRLNDVERTIAWFDVACDLGSRFVRVNAGSPRSTVNNEARVGLVDSLRRLAEAAHQRGMKLLVENHGGSSSNPEFLIGLIEEVGRDGLGLLLDLGNFEPLISVSRGRFADPHFDESGMDFEPVYAAIARLAPYADQVDAKSIDPERDGRPLPDIARALGIVAAAGYDGSVSVEWEGRQGDPWERSRNVAKQIRSVFPALD